MYLFFHQNMFSQENSGLEKGGSAPLPPFCSLLPPFLPPFLSPFFPETFFFSKKSFSQMKIIFEKKIVKIVRRLVMVPELIRRSV